jgi:endonuclease/exonuclease/phosphatase family metal-dependent hydrolase
MERTIRLCTWNIQLGLQFETILRTLSTFQDFRELDLLALQEASFHEGREDSSLIAAELGPTYLHRQVTAHILGQYAQANALVWNSARIAVTNQDSVILPRFRQVRLSRAERTLLRVMREQRRISVVAEGHIDSQTLRIYVAHLDVLGLTFKREQFRRILEDDHKREPADLTILAGDLNTFRFRSRPSWVELTAAAEAVGFQELTSEITWTHMIRNVRIRQKLDAIFVRHLRPVRYRSWTLAIPGSDHIPVFAEITLD